MTARRVKKDRKWTLLKCCFFIYAFIFVFVLIWLRIGVVNLEYQLGELGSKKTKLMKQGRILSAERASLYSAGKIEKIATKQLGMIFPERERVFFVKKTISAAPYRVSIKSTPMLSDNSSDRNIVKNNQLNRRKR
jgi:cell division protein FtsL